MILDFMESLWNFLQLSYSHLKICPEILENKHFLRPTSNSYNSQTIWPIAMKIWPKQDK